MTLSFRQLWPMASLLCALTTFSSVSFAEQAGAQKPAVIVQSAERKIASTRYEVAGRVKAATRVDIIPRVSGLLIERNFKEGALVEKGQTLFHIEKEPFEIKVKQAKASLLSAKASLKQAEAELKRQKTLRKSNATSKSTLESAEAQRDQAKASVLEAEAGLQQANLEFSYTNIQSPLSGRIGRTQLNTGNLVAANSSNLASVVQIDPIHVEISVSDKELLDVRRRSPQLDTGEVIPRLLLADGKPYDQTGQFDVVDPEVNTQTDSVIIRATFPNPQGLLLPGEFVRVIITPSNPQSAVLISQAAVQRDRDGFFVMLVNNSDTVEQRRVELGEQIGSEWVVLSGLTEGERVITAGLQKVRNGQAVNATEE